MLTPRTTPHLIGHNSNKDHILNAYHSGRFAHAWILEGEKGIGKTTFAFHMARYILSNRHDGNTQFDVNDPLFRRIATGAHGDLAVVERTPMATKPDQLSRDITIDQIRDLNQSLTQTTAEGGWRVVIVDGLESLNRNASNALLKNLEEPPSKTVFFLVSHQGGRLLPTLRSRCQSLHFTPLSNEEVREVMQYVSPGALNEGLIEYAKGSPGRYLQLIQSQDLGIHLKSVLSQVPLSSIQPALPLLKAAGEDEESFKMVQDVLLGYLHTCMEKALSGGGSFTLEQILSVWDKITQAFRNCERAQLDRKATLFYVFSTLEKDLQ